MSKRGWIIAAFAVVFIVLAVMMAPLSNKWKAECDSLGGFYDYKSTGCWSDQGYEVLAWKS